MILQPGMIFRQHEDSLEIIDTSRYKGHHNQIIFHGQTLNEDLIKYGWVLDESSVVDLILKKYEG